MRRSVATAFGIRIGRIWASIVIEADELRTAYAACDVLVSASNFETLGNVVIEACEPCQRKGGIKPLRASQ
eukprot:1482155-Amphidinium_carterae.1